MKQRSPVASPVLAVVLLAAAGCGGQSTAGDPPPGPTSGPITELVDRQWNWVGVDGAFCGDGSPTGIGVYPGSSDLLVFLDGGGACWDWQTCFGPLRNLSIITAGPFGRDQFLFRQAFSGGSVLDPAAPSNPFAGWTMVFVPYCTGDVHAGDQPTVYTSPDGQAMTFHHVGHSNVVAALTRLVATYPAPSRLVVAGSSAGGFGSFIDYPTFRAAWPDAPSWLVDDSGPAVEGLDPQRTGAWAEAWHLADSTGAWCPDCLADLSAAYPALSAQYPADRMALLSYVNDGTISIFFALSSAQLATALESVATDVLAPLPGWRWYYQSGTSHTMLGNLSAHEQSGVSLTSFLEKMIGGDPTWSSVSPF